ncbi:SurA N-terminal domain-containing protein [Rhizobiales bacterium]|uniref:peptidylprolyl isomerase n=1 Tax=Hongsoonwoonella zoysiae TaxID=2821844 RepID=UPI00155F86D9|nr:peptidylprolyl isomerase [Hongsoonwoonella zoysiae]NRG18716.1 SurA N-terminal domain-containing protein [Hongsoonwoonella zoysiae]
MLDALRNSAKSWLAKLLIGLLVMSFAIWGISGNLLTIGGGNIATVGDQKITAIEFENAYRRRLDVLGRQLGRPITPAQGAAFGVPGQVLGQLVAEAALNEVAQDLNLGISDEELLTLIQRDPSFQSASGGFDRNRLAQLLAANQVTEDEFVESRRLLARRQQLAEGLAGGVNAPEVFLEAVHRHANETRVVRYMDLAPELTGEIAMPDEATLEAFFDENKGEFRAPEYRAVSILEVTPEKIARPEEVSTDAVRDAYERSQSRFGEPEKRRILQITYDSAEAAAEAAAKLASGTTFEDLLEEQSLTEEDADLGLIARDALFDSAIADAAFALREGETSGAIDGRLTDVIVKVSQVQPARTRPLEEVEDTLRQELAEATAEREVLDLHDEVEDARAGGATLAEVADRFGLELRKLAPFDSAGSAEDGTEAQLPDVRDFISEVFQSDVGVENDPLQVGRRGFLWFEVNEVTPERERELDEVRDQVVERWMSRERAKRLDEIAKTAKDELDSGKTLEEVAAGLGVEVKISEPFTRGNPSGDLTAAAVSAAFSGPQGTIAGAEGKDGHRLLLAVDEVSAPAFFAEAGEVAQLGQRLAQDLQDSIVAQYVGAMENRVGVSIDQAALSRVLGLGATDG